MWLLGNLARATYVRSTNHMWPFSFNHCDKSAFNTQEINKCLKVTHYGMVPGVGRGAPEIDILEAMQGGPGKLPHTNIQHPYISTSLQVAPGKAGVRPVAGQLPLKVSAIAQLSQRLRDVPHPHHAAFVRIERMVHRT